MTTAKTTLLFTVFAMIGTTACAPDSDPTNSAAKAATSLPAPVTNPLEVGSQEVRDHMYCSGVIFAAHPEPLDAPLPAEETIRIRATNQALELAMSAMAQLTEQGAVEFSQASDIVDAWADVAATDLKAGTPRITLEQCTARASALPPHE